MAANPPHESGERRGQTAIERLVNRKFDLLGLSAGFESVDDCALGTVHTSWLSKESSNAPKLQAQFHANAGDVHASYSAGDVQAVSLAK